MDSGVENAPPASLGPGYLSWRIEDLIARTKSLYGILSSHKNSKASEAKQLLASIRNLFGVLHALSLTVSSFDDGDSADTSSDVPCLVQCHQDLASFEALLADRDGSTGVGSDWPVLATRMRVRLEQHIAQLKLASYAESRWRFFKCMTAAALPELSTGRQPLAAEDQSNDADPTLDTSTQPPPITPSEGAVPEWPPTFSTPELLRSRLLLSDATDVGASLKRFPDILRWLPGTVSTSSSTQPFCSPALRPDNESILLTGAAACGKSVFVAGLLRLLRERAAEDVYRHVILYHLIDYRSKLPRTHTDHREQAHPKSICLTDPAVGRMLEDFVNQLTEQLPEDLERLDDPKTRIWDAVEKSKYSDDVREGNYEPILNLIIEALGCIDCVYVLLDGLDELEYGCGPNEQKGHQDALLKTLEALKRQPGVRMRILVAVRPNIAGRVEPFITPCTKVEYSPSRDELAQFARRRLGEMRLHSRTAPPVSPELRETMAAMLADRAAGK